MDTWPDFYRKIADTIVSLHAPIIYFRGHTEESWALRPGLGRLFELNSTPDSEAEKIEEALYFDFVTGAGDLIPRSSDTWDHLFLMQHHGLPTRLLDWTESFPIALFFALQNESRQPCIWLLNPFALNQQATKSDELMDIDDFPQQYREYFVKYPGRLKASSFPHEVVAVRPRKHVRRLAQQMSGFTLHKDVRLPLEDSFAGNLRKFVIPESAIRGATEFLRLVGMSEFTLFPDLDGLARHLKQTIFRDFGLKSA